MNRQIEKCSGFQWDEWNPGKNWELHDVTNGECEEVFLTCRSLSRMTTSIQGKKAGFMCQDERIGTECCLFYNPEQPYSHYFRPRYELLFLN